MATIEDRFYVRRDGKKVRTTYTGAKRYRVRYREYPQGPLKSVGFERRGDAEQWLASTRHNLLAGTYVDPQGGRETFGAFWASYRATRVDLRSTTAARDESYYSNHIEPVFATRPLAAIDAKFLRTWVADMTRQGLAPKTVRHAFGLVSQALGVAAADHAIARNPAADMKGLPEVIVHEMRCFTPDEVATLEASIDKRYRTWLRTAVGAGLRLGELSALRPERLDLMKRTITVAETMIDVRGYVSFGPPKTKAGRRTVPITGPLAERLTTASAGLAANDLVFTAPAGGPIRASLLRRRIWQPACVAAGLAEMVEDPDDEDAPAKYVGPRIHDLRHTAVSWWIASGADVKQIAAWAGHSSVATVLDRYGHLMPDRAQAAMDALEALEAAGRAAEVAKVLAIVEDGP